MLLGFAQNVIVVSASPSPEAHAASHAAQDDEDQNPNEKGDDEPSFQGCRG